MYQTIPHDFSIVACCLFCCIFVGEINHLCYFFKCFYGLYNIDISDTIPLHTEGSVVTTRQALYTLRLKSYPATRKRQLILLVGVVLVCGTLYPVHDIRPIQPSNGKMVSFKNALLNYYWDNVMLRFNSDNVCI